MGTPRADLDGLAGAPDNWRNGGKPAQAAFAAVAKAIARFEPVTVCASAGQYENARARLDDGNIRVVEISSDDAWVRDTGPTFVIDDKGDVRGVDWGFNAWGGFEGGLYFPWQRDDQVARKILEIERRARYRTDDFVLEGGSIHVDGEGHADHHRGMPAQPQPQPAPEPGGDRADPARLSCGGQHHLAAERPLQRRDRRPRRQLLLLRASRRGAAGLDRRPG
ncbi:agmatine deiminase [Pseudomonas aeruginosa]|nr:agmatine deiminase [Pseudomonas aeruginosa]